MMFYNGFVARQSGGSLCNKQNKEMKTLVSRENPEVRIVVPNVELIDRGIIPVYYVPGWKDLFVDEWELVEEEQKPEWSEEDEAMRNDILRLLSCFVGTVECDSNPSLSTSYPTYQREIDWLKSLRPQPKDAADPVDIEKALELVEKHLELFTAGNLDRRKGYTKHDMQDAFILGFKAGIKRR